MANAWKGEREGRHLACPWRLAYRLSENRLKSHQTQMGARVLGTHLQGVRTVGSVLIVEMAMFTPAVQKHTDSRTSR